MQGIIVAMAAKMPEVILTEYGILLHVLCGYHLFLPSQAISRGIDSVKKIVEERQLSGVYGPLIENFSCEPRVFTAVEVTAGNRLDIHTQGIQ